MRRIVAIGGGGFMMEDARSPIDDFLLAITGKRAPRICFVPTACGDSQEKIAAFYAAFGMSAGAIAWFERGLTDSWGGGDLVAIDGLGLLAGGCAPHYNGEANRRPCLHREIAAGRMPASIAIDDGAAVVYTEGRVERIVRWQRGSNAYRVSPATNRVEEAALDAEALPS